MKAFFSIRPKLQVALVFFVLPAMLLFGILIERHFLQKVDTASTSLFNDRLMPATFVYQLTDHIHQRHRLAEQLFLTHSMPTEGQEQQFAAYQANMDSILLAFEQTYLVSDEAESLERLRAVLAAYGQAEQEQLLDPTSEVRLHKLENQLDEIRGELLELSTIQTSVGKELLHDAETVVANAWALNKFEIVILILCVLVVQILLFTSRSMLSPVRQKPGLN